MELGFIFLCPDAATPFRRIALAPHETKTVSFQVTSDKLQFYNAQMKRVVEPGAFRAMVGTSSAEYLTSTFEIQN